MVREKIKNKLEIQKILTDLRAKKPGIKIISTNGAFDIIHRGHVSCLESAKKLGDYLIVGLNSDKSIKRYKSKNRPIIPQDDRAIVLAGFGMVDFVVIFEEDDPRDLLRYIKPDIHVKSKSGYKGIEKEIVEENGGKIVLIDDIGGVTTTQIINKIKKLSN